MRCQIFNQKNMKNLLLSTFLLFIIGGIISCSSRDDENFIQKGQENYLLANKKIAIDSKNAADMNNVFGLVGSINTIYGFYSSARNQHYYSANEQAPIPSYFSERTLGTTSPSYSGAMISSWYNTSNGDLLLTVTPEEVSNKGPWIKKEEIGYSYPRAETGIVPVYRYYRSSTNSHFYTTSWNELGNGKYGFAYERIEFYLRAW